MFSHIICFTVAYLRCVSMLTELMLKRAPKAVFALCYCVISLVVRFELEEP